MKKPAITAYPIDNVLKQRWSPRAFEPRSLSSEQMGSLMEAARWSPSSSNAQPWRFLVATRDEDTLFARMLEPLNEKNTRWAKDAGALILAIEQTHGDDGSTLTYSAHDLGLANASIVFQAEAMDLRTHQMAGFDKAKARELFDIPEGFRPMTYIAVGHQAEPESLPDELEEREKSPRSRKPLDEIVFRGKFGQS